MDLLVAGLGLFLIGLGAAIYRQGAIHLDDAESVLGAVGIATGCLIVMRAIT